MITILELLLYFLAAIGAIVLLLYFVKPEAPKLEPPVRAAEMRAWADKICGVTYYGPPDDGAIEHTKGLLREGARAVEQLAEERARRRLEEREAP